MVEDDPEGSSRLGIPGGAAGNGLGLEIAIVQWIRLRCSRPQAASRTQGWIWFDSTPLLQDAWHLPEGEPDDNNAGTEIHRAQLVIIDHLLTFLHDAIGDSSYGIICECDGTSVAAAAQDFVDRDPSNPN